MMSSMSMNIDMGIATIGSEDLLHEIFLHLPPVSLFRFKYVSKSWYSLISNLDFLLRYSHKNKNNIDNYSKQRMDLLLLGPSRNPVDVIDSALSIFRLNLCLPESISTNKDELVLNNSCNGLLLYHQRLMPDYNVLSNNNRHVFYVCNPITKHYIKIPNIEHQNVVEEDKYKKGTKLKINVEEQYKKFMMMNTTKACIVFDPSISLSYKIIRCCFNLTITKSRDCYDHSGDCLCRKNVLYVYSSKTRSWKHLTSFRRVFSFGFRSALVNGVFYWYTEIGDDCFCFDVEKEKVWFIQLPTRPYKQLRICLYFGECSGQLCLIEKYHCMKTKDEITFPCSFDIMELVQQQQEDQGQCIWRVKYHVNMDLKFDHFIQSCESLNGFIMHLYRRTTGKKMNEEEEEEEDTLLMNIVGTDLVVSFNLTSHAFGEEVIVIPNIKHTSKLGGVVPYTPTFFPVHL